MMIIPMGSHIAHKTDKDENHAKEYEDVVVEIKLHPLKVPEGNGIEIEQVHS